jgi:hypothetical protein
MPVAGTLSAIALTDEERSFLFGHLEQLLRERQVEEHRTDALDFKHLVHHEVELIQRLLDKLRRP